VRPKPPREPTPAAIEGGARKPSRYAAGFRPAWHKVIGAFLLLGGAFLFFTCEFDGWHLHEHGGHVWYLVGGAIAASSSWWFGIFDTTFSRRRI
jgi:hypothetical protein